MTRRGHGPRDGTTTSRQKIQQRSQAIEDSSGPPAFGLTVSRCGRKLVSAATRPPTVADSNSLRYFIERAQRIYFIEKILSVYFLGGADSGGVSNARQDIVDASRPHVGSSCGPVFFSVLFFVYRLVVPKTYDLPAEAGRPTACSTHFLFRGVACLCSRTAEV